MKKTLLKTFLFVALGISVISTSAISNNNYSASKNVLAEDASYGVDAKWTYNSSNIALADNESDGAFGFNWSYDDGARRIHFYVEDDLLPDDLGSKINTTHISNNLYKNSNGTVVEYIKKNGIIPSNGYLGFTGHLLSHNVLSIEINKTISNLIQVGDTIKINGQVKFVNKTTNEYSMDHVIQFDNIVVEYTGKGWQKTGDVIHIDSSKITDKNNDSWIVSAHNKPAGFNLPDYTVFNEGWTHFTSYSDVSFVHDGTTYAFNTRIQVDYEDGAKHSFVSLLPTYTGLSDDIVPKAGDILYVPTLWVSSATCVILFSNAFSLTCNGSQWTVNTIEVETLTGSGLSIMPSGYKIAKNRIYFYRNNADDIVGEESCSNYYRSTSALATYVYGDSEKGSANIKITIYFVAPRRTDIVLESWGTGLSANISAAAGDKLYIDNCPVYRGKAVIYLQDLTFEYVGTTGWEVIWADYTNSTEADCEDTFLKTVVPGKIKNFDQCTTAGAEGGTPSFVKARKNNTFVDALYFSHTTSDWAADATKGFNYNFAEFRFLFNCNISTISFSYRTNNVTTDICDVDDSKINGMNAYLEVITADGGYANASKNSYSCTNNDYAWHDITINLGGVGIKGLIFKFYEIVGEILISNISYKTVADQGNSLDASKMALSFNVDADLDADGNITAINNDDVRLRCAVDLDIYNNFDNSTLGSFVKSSGNIYGIKDYGIQLNSQRYSLLEDKYKHLDNDNGFSYVVIDLGSMLNSKTRLTTEFTVSAYVEIATGDSTSEVITYASSTTYTVKSMVEYYVANAASLGITGDTLTNLTKINTWISSICKDA